MMWQEARDAEGLREFFEPTMTCPAPTPDNLGTTFPQPVLNIQMQRSCEGHGGMLNKYLYVNVDRMLYQP